MEKAELGTQAVYTNHGKQFATKKAADNYGLTVTKVKNFAIANDIDEATQDKMLEAFSEGVFELPKAVRKPKAKADAKTGVAE